MNNYERIKRMSVEEMANQLDDFLYLTVVEKKINSTEEVKQWLLEGVENA